MRLFVAVDLSDEARRAVADEQKRIAATLDRATSLRWVGANNLHITLVFLGEVPDAGVGALVSSLNADLPAPPFDLTLQGLGVFPPRGAPRALWLGAHHEQPGLVGLHDWVSQRVEALGIVLEQRAFRPHLTLARWRHSRPSDRQCVIDAARSHVVARMRVGRVTLFQSLLSPAGSTYTALAHATLTGDSETPSRSHNRCR